MACKMNDERRSIDMLDERILDFRYQIPPTCRRLLCSNI